MAVRRIEALAMAAVAVVCTLVAVGLGNWVAGPSLDALYLLSEWTFGPRPAPPGTPVVVVGLDEETYRRPPFAGTPQALWPPHMAPVFNALDQADVKAIGVDLIYPTSVEAAIPGFEREFLLALRRVGKAGKLVLAKVQHQTQPLLPYRGYAIAAGGGGNIHSVNLVEDPDGVLRRIPLTLAAAGPDGQPVRETGFAAELARRSAGPDHSGPDYSRDTGNTLLINHPTAAGAIPAYSLADLYACAKEGRADYFTKHFAGKVVLFGTVLDVEDRKLSSNRWVTKPEGLASPERCVLPEMAELYDRTRSRDTIPGVFIHAAAIGNLLTGNSLHELESPQVALLCAVLALLATLATGLLPPAPAVTAIAALLAAWTGVATLAFHHGQVWPWLSGLIAALPVYPILLGFRFAVVDRDQRHIRNAFKLYLPGQLIDEMIAKGQSPSLGGEEKQISILFSDIAGYTKFSEGLPPEELVTILNRYFTAMTDIIIRNGGFVDKYIGDAILAVFGAPYCPNNHAVAAVQSALEMGEALKNDPSLLSGPDRPPASIRIGIATGPALIGNIGSPQRFNYTVMGDTVNLASRLEGANKAVGSAVLVSDATVTEHGDPSVFRELDTVQVVGRNEPVTLYEPLSSERRTDAADTNRRAAYAEALASWRAGDFAAAAAGFAALAEKDPVAAKMLAKVEKWHGAKPDNWTGVTALTEK